MTFSASLRLNSKEFRRGVADVQKSLKSLQASFLSVAGALGLGLSFNRLGSELLNTATKLSVAKNTLENVSKEIGEYGQNLEWLRKISNRYGQDMVSLINSFAQFRAAAASSKLSLEQMRDIYEALTRAAGAYHMSADRTNDMMNAVTQMLSKGRVAAEELRRQLGNSLPGAFNLMAQAAYNAGIITDNSTAALEKAMKSGKVMAEDVLPSFAKILNDVTATANFDSLQTSMNRLRNSWTEMVEAGNFEGLYKGIIDGANNVLQYFSTSFWPKIAAGMGGIFGSTALAGGMKSFVANVRKTATDASAEFDRLYSKLNLMDYFGKPGFKFNEEKNKIIPKPNEDNFKSIEAYEKAVKKWEKQVEKASEKIKFAMGINKSYFESINDGGESINKAIDEAQKFNNNLLKMNEEAKNMGNFKFMTKAQVKYVEDMNAQLEGLRVKAESSTKDISLMNAAINKVGLAFKAFGRIVASALSSLAIGAIIGGLAYLVAKIIEARKEAERINNIADDMVSSVKNVSIAENDTVVRLNTIKRQLEGITTATSKATRTKLIEDANKALGRTGKNLLTIEDDIKTKVLPAIDDYISKIKTAAMQQAILASVGEKTSRILKLQEENRAMREDPEYGATRKYRGDSGEWEGLTPRAAKLNTAIDKNTKEIAELQKGIDRLIGPLGNNPDFIGPIPPWQANSDTLARLTGGKTDDDGGSNNDDPGKPSKDTPSSDLEKYKKELAELENQYKNGAITLTKYKEEVDRLNENTFKSLASHGPWDKVLKALKSQSDRELANAIKAGAQDYFSREEEKEAEKYDEEMQKMADKAYEEWSKAWNRFLDLTKKEPALVKVDTDDAYMKSNKRKRGQTFSEREDYLNTQFLNGYEKDIKNLESYKKSLEDALATETNPDNIERINKVLDEVIAKLERLGLVSKDLKAKVDLAKIENDLIKLRKQGIENLFTSFTTLSNGVERLYNAYKAVMQINDSAWQDEALEEFLTKLNLIIQALEVMKSVYSALKIVEETYTKIKEKSAAREIALNAGVAASENAKATASAKAAVAGAAAGTAGIPAVGIGLAIAGVIALTALLTKSMGKFAKGGIVGGSSYSGDNNIARVNSGELVITRGQQAQLWNFIKGGSKGGSKGDVEFKIRGDQLVGVLNNYNRIRS